MNHLLLLTVFAMAAGPIQFERHEIDAFPDGYQVAVADINGNGRPDVIALSTEANRVDWYENPGWKRRPLARTPRNIDLAPHDIDGDGRLEIALAGGFYFSESNRGGDIWLLGRPTNLDDPWHVHPVAVDPVVHRLQWGDLNGDGRAELIHAPVFGPGSDTTRDPKPSHLWAFRIPGDYRAGPYDVWKIDETLTVLHGLHVSDLNGDGRDEILTASFEGIHRFDFESEDGRVARWRKTQIAPGAPPVDEKRGASRGSSEVVPGKFADDRPFLAAIEPWHGHQVVVYTPGEAEGPWRRRVLDEALDQGHALVVADFDGDGVDEIVAGWRGGEGGLVMYDPVDSNSDNDAENGEMGRFRKTVIERGITIDGAVAADINGNGRLDLVVVSGRSNRLLWYENR